MKIEKGTPSETRRIFFSAYRRIGVRFPFPLMKILFLDCFSGISGDMTVGALCDLGVKPSTLEWELSKVNIGDFHMHFERKQRKGIEGVKFGIHEGATHTHEQDEHEHGAHAHEHKHPVHDHDHDHGEEVEHHAHEHGHGHEHGHAHEHTHEGHSHSHSHEGEYAHEHGHCHEHGHTHSHEHTHEGEHAHSHEHDHDHGHEGHEHTHSHAHSHEHGHSHAHSHDDGHAHVHGRNHQEIRQLIEASELSPFVKKHALGIFERIARAEGKIHGMPVESVAFHEVGALDSIADIICACVGIEALGVDAIYVSPLHEGRGWIECAHGRFPIPAPATLEILSGISLGATDETHELITPTGAAIVAEFAKSFGPMPRMKAEKVGYGIGSRDLASRPNVLRAVLGELEA